MIHILALVLKYILNKCSLILLWEACFIFISDRNVSSHLVIFKDLDLAKNKIISGFKKKIPFK